MIEMIKNNKKEIKIGLLITFCSLIAFYIVYKLESTLFVIVAGAIMLLVGVIVKDPEKNSEESNKEKYTQLTIFSEEVLAPVEIKKTTKKTKAVASKKKSTKKTDTVIKIEDTKIEEVEKTIKKSEKVKA